MGGSKALIPAISRVLIITSPERAHLSVEHTLPLEPHYQRVNPFPAAFAVEREKIRAQLKNHPPGCD